MQTVTVLVPTMLKQPAPDKPLFVEEAVGSIRAQSDIDQNQIQILW
jgi:hypothetical protein